MSSDIDDTKPAAGHAYTANVRANFAAAKAEIEALQAAVVKPDVQIFTADGTWTKPANVSQVLIWLVGGGGGGGGGQTGGVGSFAQGGEGGSGGACGFVTVPASILGATESVVVGAGGTGGAAVSTDDTRGEDGLDGGNTTFGSLYKAPGGYGGSGGNLDEDLYGQSRPGVPGVAYDSGEGGYAYNGISGYPYQNQNTVLGPAGGGYGGSVSDTGTIISARFGSSVAQNLQGFGPQSSVDGGTNGSTNGNGSDGDDYVTGTLNGAGGGGGGGGSINATAAGNGGNGGTPGGGAGGGGASKNGGGDSGAGGTGGDGIAIIISY